MTRCNDAGKLAGGPAGTFNYLIDLITQVPSTRQMYMRRLRTLTDEYYGTGKLIQVTQHLLSNCLEVSISILQRHLQSNWRSSKAV